MPFSRKIFYDEKRKENEKGREEIQKSQGRQKEIPPLEYLDENNPPHRRIVFSPAKRHNYRRVFFS